MPNRPPFDPYVGPQPFRRSDSKRFFGRAESTDELFSLVLASRVIILYAQSGAGKSSVVNAGLWPLLEKNGFDVLPIARVQGGLPAGKTASQLGNPYVYFTVASWGQQVTDAAAEGTLNTALARLPRGTDRYGDPVYRLLIFDQFEELFTSFPACWAQRSRFAAELARCVALDERLRILFVVREDHLADVLSLAEAFPASHRSSMRLPLLGADDAVEAIEGPLRGTGFSYAEGVADKLAEDLTRVRVETSPGEVVEVPGDSIEPVQLQVVCTELWRALPPGATVITAEHVSALGDATAALAHYYDNAVRGTARRAKVDPIFVRRWISSELVTPAKTRGTAYRGVRLTAGLPNPAVDALENRHVIRAETRAGAHWYELTHDRFLRPVEQANVRAMRRSMLGYWGAVMPAAILVTVLLIVHPWPGGRDDVLLRFASALFAAAWLVWASWIVARRRPRYWWPCEKQRRGVRLATIGRKWWIALVVAILGSVLGIFAWSGFVWATYCGPDYNEGPLVTLYRHGSATRHCLSASSTWVNLALAACTIILAAVIAYTLSWLHRGLAVRRWRRMAERRIRARKPEDEEEFDRGVASDEGTAPRLAEVADQPLRNTGMTAPPN
jgi:hypothetical protein